jgi:hypothetical protein
MTSHANLSKFFSLVNNINTNTKDLISMLFVLKNMILFNIVICLEYSIK